MEKPQSIKRKRIKLMKLANQVLKGISKLMLAAAVLVLSLFLLKCIQKADSPADVVAIVSSIGAVAIGIVKQMGKTTSDE